MKEVIVAICDDNPQAIIDLREKIQDSVKEKDLFIKIEEFESGLALLESNLNPQILFLDIEMPGRDGIETARLLRQRDNECRIIMATSRVDRFKEGYHVGAVRFITKPFEAKEIKEALEYALGTFSGMEIIHLFQDRNRYRIPQKKIKYLVAFDGYTEVAVDEMEKRMRTEESLDNLEKILDSRLFCRISRSQIINWEYVNSCDKGKIFMDKEVFEISRRRKKEVEKLYCQYDLYHRR